MPKTDAEDEDGRKDITLIPTTIPVAIKQKKTKGHVIIFIVHSSSKSSKCQGSDNSSLFFPLCLYFSLTMEVGTFQSNYNLHTTKTLIILGEVLYEFSCPVIV